jgi:zinc transport system ATP-binding protein
MKPLVTMRDVSVVLEGTPILRDISADVERGKITALLGLNGSGKTTLLRTILKELPYSGAIRFHCGHNHEHPQPDHVGYVPQRLRLETNFPCTVRDLLAVALTHRPVFLGVTAALETRLRELLARVGAPVHLLDRPMDRISGGEQQRVLLGLALDPNPELLLLDEPAAGIDFKDQESFYDLIRRINAERGVTVVLVSHDTSVVYQHAHHVLCLRDGRIAHQGPPAVVMTRETLEEVFGAGSMVFHHNH